MNFLFESAFTLWGASTSWLELIAVTLAFICVAFNVLENPLGWPFAVVSCLLYMGLFSHHKLYGDAGVQVFFALAALWAWWEWMFGHRRTQAGTLATLRIARLRSGGRIRVVLAWLILWPAIGYLLMRVTDSDVPYFDAFPTAGSVIGQILLGRKFLENWLVWLVVNLASVALLSYKSLYLSAALYVVFIAMAYLGWRRWRLQIPAVSST
jgi:nicotinamide mononucleotide transporter